MLFPFEQSSLQFTFNSVRLSVVKNIRRAQGSAGSVIVYRGRFQFSKLGKKFLDVCLCDSQVQVRNHQLAGASSGQTEAGSASPSSLEPVVKPLAVGTPHCRPRPGPHLSSTTTHPTSAAASAPTSSSRTTPRTRPRTSLGCGASASGS